MMSYMQNYKDCIIIIIYSLINLFYNKNKNTRGWGKKYEKTASTGVRS